MAIVERVASDRRFLLRGVPWQTYLSLREAPENHHLRMTYDRGDLEMMSPSAWHERLGYVIGRLIDVWTVELNIDVQSCRTMTFKREDLDRGLEPDNCYYVKHEPLVWDKVDLDLSVDPPPDLAIEIELGGGEVSKMDLYAAFGVPEVWRFDGETLQVCALGADGRYAPRDSSLSFARLPLDEIQRLLRQVGSVRETALVRSFRDWVRANIVPTMKPDP